MAKLDLPPFQYSQYRPTSVFSPEKATRRLVMPFSCQTSIATELTRQSRAIEHLLACNSETLYIHLPYLPVPSQLEQPLLEEE